METRTAEDKAALAALRARLDGDPEDWSCRLVLSDWYLEHDMAGEAALQRWLVEHKKRPDFGGWPSVRQHGPGYWREDAWYWWSDGPPENQPGRARKGPAGLHAGDGALPEVLVGYTNFPFEDDSVKEMEKAFLAELKKDPADRATLCAYADWLEESGRTIDAAAVRQGLQPGPCINSLADLRGRVLVGAAVGDAEDLILTLPGGTKVVLSHSPD